MRGNILEGVNHPQILQMIRVEEQFWPLHGPNEKKSLHRVQCRQPSGSEKTVRVEGAPQLNDYTQGSYLTSSAWSLEGGITDSTMFLSAQTCLQIGISLVMDSLYLFLEHINTTKSNN